MWNKNWLKYNLPDEGMRVVALITNNLLLEDVSL